MSQFGRSGSLAALPRYSAEFKLDLAVSWPAEAAPVAHDPREDRDDRQSRDPRGPLGDPPRNPDPLGTAR